MAARPSVNVPDPGLLSVLIEPFEKAPGRSSIAAVEAVLRTRFPGFDWSLRKADSGRPMDRDNRWHLSVSHTAGCLAIAVSKPVCGIDLEVLRHPDRWRGLYDWITPPDARLSTPTERDFLRAWTTKEALLKCQGLGLEGGMQHQPIPEYEAPGWQRVSVNEQWLYVRHTRFHPGISLALACSRPLPIEWRTTRPLVSSQPDTSTVA